MFQSLAGSPSTSHSSRSARTMLISSMFQSQAGSPSTSHQREQELKALRKGVSIPGGKPLHEPPRGAFFLDFLGKVSIPGGKPLHEPLIRNCVISPASNVFQSLAGSPSTSHSGDCHMVPAAPTKFQSQAGSPSTSHQVDFAGVRLSHRVSIPGGKPLHEPLGKQLLFAV